MCKTIQVRMFDVAKTKVVVTHTASTFSCEAAFFISVAGFITTGGSVNDPAYTIRLA